MSIYMWFLIAGESYCAEQRIRRLARIEPRMLHDDRDTRFDQTRIRRVARDFFRVVKIVEAQMLCSSSRYDKLVGPDRVAVFKKNHDLDLRRLGRSVQDAARFVAGHRR